MSHIAAAVVGIALASTQMAADERMEVILAVGETVELDVGYARGFICDDPTIVYAELRSKASDANELILTGMAPGATLCRAGLDVSERSYLFDVTVVQPPPPNPRGPKTPPGPPPR